MLKTLGANSPAGGDGGIHFPSTHAMMMQESEANHQTIPSSLAGGVGASYTAFPQIPSGLGTWPPLDMSMDPDPQAEPLLDMAMDISGSVLFDPNLLNMIKFN